jgi:hypothetical protein
LCREFHQFWWLMERICVVHHFTHRRWRTKKGPFYYGFLKNQSWGRMGNHTAVGISRLVQLFFFLSPHLKNAGDHHLMKRGEGVHALLLIQ